jgi:hypothetical protein
MSSTTARINPTQRPRRQRLRSGETGPGVVGGPLPGGAGPASKDPSPYPGTPSAILARES